MGWREKELAISKQKISTMRWLLQQAGCVPTLGSNTNDPRIKPTNFRKSFNILSESIRLTCKVLSIGICQRNRQQLDRPPFPGRRPDCP